MNINQKLSKLRADGHITDVEYQTLNQKVKYGHWIERKDDVCWWYVCSECGQEPLKGRWDHDDVLSRYCPHCGARMGESEGEG